jgi:PAS domain S-box-containing protein
VILAPATIMTRDGFVVGHPDQDIDDVIFPGLGRLPVVDDEGRVIALITRTDLAGVFYNSYQVLASQLDTIIDSTHNMIIATDCEGRIKVFNNAAERMLDVKAEEVRGRPIVEIFPNSGLPDTIRSGVEKPLQKITLNGRNLISNRSPIKKDGEIIGAVAVLQDISELEQISQELKYVKELNEELDAIIESSFDGLYIADGEGKTLRVNKAFEMIMGISREEFLGKNVEDIEKEGLVSESVTFLTLNKRKPVTIIQEAKTGKITLATGSPVYDKNGNIFRVVCNVRDITELNLLKQRLEQAEGLSQHYESELRTLKLQFMGSSNMVINSSSMRDILEVVNRLSQVDSTTLITGESGTGKELIAETIHNYSSRKNEPFIRVNCGAIPDNLLESELFGYEYGAFSGAKQEGKPGFFELAKVDVSKFEEMQAFADKTFSLYPDLALFFNNAGVEISGTIWELSMKDWEWVYGVNVFGIIHGLKAFVPKMLKQDKEAIIINTSSLAGLISGHNSPIYLTGKHAVVALTEALELQLQQVQSKIKAFVFCPAYVKTNLHKAERNRPAELANENSEYYQSEDYKKKQGMMQYAVPNGMELDQAMDIVFEALEKDLFYIQTNPEFLPRIEQRFNNIMQNKRPVFAG